MTRNYPIAKPYITNKEISYVNEVLRSGILSLGPKYKKFENKFAKYVGSKYACAVSSGTAGLHLALIAAGIKKNDEVITSPFSFIASSNSILYLGAKPVFIDVEKNSYNMDASLIEKKINKHTKAILVVHIFGQASNMEKINRIAKKHNLFIIEDACESLGARYKKKMVGNFGKAGVFAFYPNKQITTGEGGMIVTNSKKVYALCDSLRNQGRSNNMQWLDHQRLGYNYRMDEMSAAVGIAQIEKIDFMLKERTKIKQHYEKYLDTDLLELPKTMPNNHHTWFVYVPIIKNKKINRDKLIAELYKKSISTKPYLPSIHLFSFYKKKFGYKNGDFPVSEHISRYSLALPFYIGLKKNDIEYISKIINTTLKKYE